jgi:hypothetical protein
VVKLKKILAKILMPKNAGRKPKKKDTKNGLRTKDIGMVSRFAHPRYRLVGRKKRKPNVKLANKNRQKPVPVGVLKNLSSMN